MGDEIRRYGDTWTDDYLPAVAFTSTGEKIDREKSNFALNVFETINELSDYDDPEHRNQSLGEYYSSKVYSEVDKLDIDNKQEIINILEGFEFMITYDIGDIINNTSLKLWAETEEIPGGHVIVPRGLKTIINALKEDLGEERYELNTVVEVIAWTEDGVTLRSSSDFYTADHAIVTIPLGVLQSNPDLFSPTLDAKKKKAIKNMRPGRASKIFLQFDNPFWREGEGQMIFLWTKEEQESAVMPQDWFKIISFVDEVEGNPDKLMIWVVGEAALVADKLEDSEIAEVVFKLMQQFSGNPNITKISKVIRHTWLTDPFSLGTYSYPSINSTAIDYQELSRPLPSIEVPRLLLAGEHTHEKFWGYMHGAMLSGIEQAERILEFKGLLVKSKGEENTVNDQEEKEEYGKVGKAKTVDNDEVKEKEAKDEEKKDEK